MNRKQFLTTGIFGSILSLFGLNKISNKKKYGYISIHSPLPMVDGKITRPSDWCVYVNGKLPPKKQNIYAVHDIEGWYEYTTRERFSKDSNHMCTLHHFQKSKIDIYYTGRSRKYEQIIDKLNRENS